MADIFDVVADPTRRELLHLLLDAYVGGDSANRELSVGEIVERLDLSQPTVSKHLRVLRDHGLVSVREEGQHRYYHLDAEPLGDLRDWVGPFLGADSEAPEIHSHDDRARTVYAAWAGSEVGEKVGRAVAETTHQARTVLEGAQDRVSRGIRRLKGEVDGESH